MSSAERGKQVRDSLPLLLFSLLRFRAVLAVAMGGSACTLREQQNFAELCAAEGKDKQGWVIYENEVRLPY